MTNSMQELAPARPDPLPRNYKPIWNPFLNRALSQGSLFNKKMLEAKCNAFKQSPGASCATTTKREPRNTGNMFTVMWAVNIQPLYSLSSTPSIKQSIFYFLSRMYTSTWYCIFISQLDWCAYKKKQFLVFRSCMELPAFYVMLIYKNIDYTLVLSLEQDYCKFDVLS